MDTLYLAWQDYQSRRWFPVGRLSACRGQESPGTEYEFSYINGALEAQKKANFPPIPGFSKLDKQYRSARLFPLFQNRVMNPARPDRPEYLRRLGLDVDADAMSELAASGGQRRTDSYQVFPALVPGDPGGRFRYRCLLHGLRYRHPDAIRRAESLTAGEILKVSSVLDNPAVSLAIKIQTRDGHHIGWMPRYLVDDLQQDGVWMVADPKAAVAQVNPDAPLSHRLLVDFTGQLPPGFRMEDLPQYRPIAIAAPGSR